MQDVNFKIRNFISKVDDKIANNQMKISPSKVKAGLLARSAIKDRPVSTDTFGQPDITERIAGYVSTIRQRRMQLGSEDES